MTPRKSEARNSDEKKSDSRKPADKRFKSKDSNDKRTSKPRTFKKENSPKPDFSKKKNHSEEEKIKTVPYTRTNRKAPILKNENDFSKRDDKKESSYKGGKPSTRNSSQPSKFAADKKSNTFKEGVKTRPSKETSATRRTPAKYSDNAVRLNKYIANAGICSRRDADALIQAGSVAINGFAVTELGSKVNPGDKVTYDGSVLINEKKVYVLLNKPKDFITTSDDPQKRRTVLSLISGACKERIYPVGRLDRMTTGVLLFTNDGDLTKKLTHPKHGVNKCYHVVLDKNFSKTDMMKIIEGVELEDGVVDVDKVSYAGDAADKKEIGIELHSGKNHIVRRLFEALGYDVVKLDRVSFAGLTKKNVKKGQWRFLTTKEVSFLNMLK